MGEWPNCCLVSCHPNYSKWTVAFIVHRCPYRAYIAVLDWQRVYLTWSIMWLESFLCGSLAVKRIKREYENVKLRNDFLEQGQLCHSPSLPTYWPIANSFPCLLVFNLQWEGNLGKPGGSQFVDGFELDFRWVNMVGLAHRKTNYSMGKAHVQANIKRSVARLRSYLKVSSTSLWYSSSLVPMYFCVIPLCQACYKILVKVFWN